MGPGREVAVIGGGWAGLAAAIEAKRLGFGITLFEMAKEPGGRARSITAHGHVLDNGQHICIGAYTETLRLLGIVGVVETDAFVRMPLRVDYPDRPGLELRAGIPLLAFGGAVWRHPGWSMGDKAALLLAASRWLLAGFRCDPALTAARLTAGLTRTVRAELIEPLCIAALNTPAAEASASVFLRVLGDALFSGRGSSDLLLPRVDLGALFPAPARLWLGGAGANLRIGHRVESLTPDGEGWSVDGEHFDAVVLAASPVESARLAQAHAPAWAETASGLRYEPIVTVYLQGPYAALAEPMLALRSDAAAPAQFVFDRGRLGGPAGLLAFVVSGAQTWVDAGADATLAATRRQAEAAFGARLMQGLETVQVVTEKRATFRCTPLLRRPALHIAPNLVGAGDCIDGPYPSTLEGAVRSGVAAAHALKASS